MVSVTTLSIVGLAALVAPGFISVLLATTIGVVEREPSRFKILIASLISSLLIDTVFLAIYQVFYEPVTGLGQLESIFFTPQFRLDFVAIYLGIAVLLGRVDEDTGEPFSDGVTESIVLLQGDIERVTVLDSETES
jgi:hypothetical protein